MLFAKEYMPQFREADADGYIGARGYLNYFQDVATHYMHNLGKGNDTLPEQYGISWIYTKYKLHIESKADFSDCLHIETWMENKKSPAMVSQAFVVSRDGKVYARGRLESCLFDIKRNRLMRLAAVDFPAGLEEERSAEVEAFTKLSKEVGEKEIESMEYGYTHKVLYTDLDKSGHMTNLKYVDLLLNVFDSAFYNENPVKDIEIHFISQCFEGEEIRVYKKEADNGIFLAGVHGDGKIAVLGFLGTFAKGD